MKLRKHLTSLLLLLCFCSLCACQRTCRHDIVVTPSVPASCTENGFTESSCCNKCNEILVPASPIPPTGHSFSQWSDPMQDAFGNWMHKRFCTVCQMTETELADPPAVPSPLGSASEISGTTLLVSIFAEDSTTSWDFNSTHDMETVSLMRIHLEAAVDWLTAQCRIYGVAPNFLYQSESYPDLHYFYDFGDEALVRTDGAGYYTQEAYIDTHISTDALLQKYNAQNIIYIFYFNTDEQNTVNSWSLSDRSGVSTEIINIFVRDDYSNGYYYMSASSMAHEIMHCFGAHDLYYASDAIPQAYVDHCRKNKSNDIMYAVSLGSEIEQELTPLDAYYLGLTDSCDLVDIWGLALSSHQDCP